MKLILLLLALPALVAETCKKRKTNDVDPSAPACIVVRIDSIKAEPRYNPPAQVNEYLYQGRRVFLFTSDCCDQFNSLLDENCAYVCAPSGGITGKGDFKCPDFDSLAQHVKLIWKDIR